MLCWLHYGDRIWKSIALHYFFIHQSWVMSHDCFFPTPRVSKQCMIFLILSLAYYLYQVDYNHFTAPIPVQKQPKQFFQTKVSALISFTTNKIMAQGNLLIVWQEMLELIDKKCLVRSICGVDEVQVSRQLMSYQVRYGNKCKSQHVNLYYLYHQPCHKKIHWLQQQ